MALTADGGGDPFVSALICSQGGRRKPYRLPPRAVLPWLAARSRYRDIRS